VDDVLSPLWCRGMSSGWDYSAPAAPIDGEFEHYACMPGTKLASQDEAILRLEGPVLAGHTCKVIALGPHVPSLDQLRARVAEGLAEAPALTMRLDGAPGRMSWVPASGFDVAEHVVAPQSRPLQRDEVPEVVARLFTERLDRARPLWRIDVLALAGGGGALVWRLHHTVADGTTAMRYARALLWDEGGSGSARGAQPAATRAVDVEDERRRRSHLARFFAREFGRARSPFDGAVGIEREVAFARLDLRALHDSARRLADATVNDALLTTVGGAVRRWLGQHHGHAGHVRVKVPVSIHHPGDELGNADSFFFIAVPLGDMDPVARLRAVRAAAATRKSEHDAETMDRLLVDLRALSPRMARLCEQIERSGRAFGLNVSNVPGPRSPVAICGSPVISMHSLAEIAQHHAVRVAAVSLSDDLFLGFCADPALVEGVATMATAAEDEAAELIAAG
jgi:hypothetical protein